jgi:glucans biosynthesis protein
MPAPSKADWVPDIDLQISSGEAKILDKRVMKNVETGGWRAFFKLDVPEKTNLLEIMSELKEGEKVISERWMYQWRR